MTASRIGRVTKGRVFIYLVCALFLVALIACYKNASNLLEESQLAHERCRQEQENTSQQLHVVFDYKQRLEKTLQTEKTEHQNAKTDFNNKLNEERLKCEKNANEGKLRFTTLQQHYNLLQTQHDDFKEECSKIQREQLDTINQLQAKLKEVQEELKRTVSDRANAMQHLRAQKDALQVENEHMKQKIEHLMQRQEPVKRTEYSSTQFNKIIPMGNAHYVVPEDREHNERDEKAALQPPSHSNNKLYTPKTYSKALNGVVPLNAPSPTPETSKSSTTKKSFMLPLPYQNNMPDGVVPAPNVNFDDSKDKNPDEKDDKKEDVKPNADLVMDDRYKNVGDKPDEKKDELKDQFNLHAADNENLANEIFDLPNNNNHNNDLDKDNAKQKKHGDELNPDANEGDYDGPNLDEGDEGDDAADGVNPLIPDAAIRN